MDYEERRTKVDDLLRKCTDEKLLRGGAERAIAVASEAVCLANKKSPPLRYPWPQLAAYRLAHLLLRSEDSEKRLDEIDGLFECACSSPPGIDNALGPLPYLYRLAVLHRRSLAKRRRMRIEPPPELHATFEQARKAVERGLANPEVSPSRIRPAHERGPIQRELFNLLELAAYFLGAEYSELEGLGAFDVGNLNRDRSWCLVGLNPSIASVRYSRALAMAELDDRGTAAPHAVVFKLLPTGTKERALAEWRMGRDSNWREANTDQIKLLALMLRYPDRPRDNLRHNLSGVDSDDGFRQLIRRTKTAFKELSGREPFLNGPGCLQLVSNVEIYGAVPTSEFHRSS